MGNRLRRLHGGRLHATGGLGARLTRRGMDESIRPLQHLRRHSRTRPRDAGRGLVRVVCGSAFLWLDHSMFGLHPAGYRLDGVLWSLALAAAVGWILCRALPGRIGTLATLIFVLSGIQAVFCWSAARHVVMAAALGFAGLVAHVRWREDGWQPGTALAPLALVLSLAASEVGIAVAVYLLAYEALGRAEGLRSRVWAALPTLIIIGVYLGTWSRFGHGATGGGYIDPLRDPALF